MIEENPASIQALAASNEPWSKCNATGTVIPKESTIALTIAATVLNPVMYLPAPSDNYYSDSQGKWISLTTNKQYLPEEIPEGIADTYVASLVNHDYFLAVDYKAQNAFEDAEAKLCSWSDAAGWRTL